MIWKYFLIFDTKEPLGIFVGKCQMEKSDFGCCCIAYTFSFSCGFHRKSPSDTAKSRSISLLLALRLYAVM